MFKIFLILIVALIILACSTKSQILAEKENRTGDNDAFLVDNDSFTKSEADGQLTDTKQPEADDTIIDDPQIDADTAVPDNADTDVIVPDTADNDIIAPDTVDNDITVPDTFDNDITVPDNVDTDTTGPDADINACSGNFPNLHDGLCWSNNSTTLMYWQDANDYCTGLGGRLPNITELRTLIQNCPATITGGACAVNDPDHLSHDADWTNVCKGCAGATDGRYSVLGDVDIALWSSSKLSENTDYAWFVGFYSTFVYYGGLKNGDNNEVRCVLESETSDNDITVPDTVDNDITVPDNVDTDITSTDADINACSGNFPNSHDGLCWSNKSTTTMYWADAITYCTGLGGRLPNITELRTLIQNCAGTVTGGACGVTDSCLAISCYSASSCSVCAGVTDGRYSVFGDNNDVILWSSSSYVNNTTLAWLVGFTSGSVFHSDKTNDYDVRCAR